MQTLKEKIENIKANYETRSHLELMHFADEFIDSLNTGAIRAAEPTETGEWQVNTWVKDGILLLFRYGKLIDMSINKSFNYYDKHTLPLRPLTLEDQVRVVPGGSAIRDGSYVAKGVICMPPMYINIGAYVDEGSLVDSHALVGACAQIGKRVHLSAAAQVGGVLEPVGARPVIIEDDVFVGGNCGVYEGVIIRKRAVLSSGVILNGSSKVYDIVNDRIIGGEPGKALEIPEGAVIVSGSRGIETDFAKANKLSLYTPIIIKYRDDKTDAKTSLEEALR